MSRYVQIAGVVEYPDDETLAEVVERLQTGGWMDAEGFFLDEAGSRVVNCRTEDGRSVKARSILEIPEHHARNLSYVDFFPDGKGVGLVVWASYDGCFEGTVIQDGEKPEVTDLAVWAADNMPAGDRLPPAEEVWEEYFAWQERVCDAFMDEFFY